LRRQLTSRAGGWPEGLELDDDPGRIDVDAVHDYLSNESYWARGRTKEQMLTALNAAARVVGLYDGSKQVDGTSAARLVGFARVVSDELTIAYLADVYVLEPYRGMGLGVELVKEAVENGPHADLRWWLATADAHGLYAKFGFANPDSRYLTRPPNYPRLNLMQKDTHGRASNQTPADEAIDSDRHP
jgi:GNAT superfamily N-acetyltransferase